VLEVETKFRSPGNEKVIEALSSMGAQLLFEGCMEDIYFSHPSRDFGMTDESVRLRIHDTATEITYKGPRIAATSTKAREELTVSVDDSLSARRMLERLGFSEFISIRKKRSSFLLDELRVEVDEVEGLGQFVELELVTEDPSRAEALMDLARKALALTKQTSETYLEMLLAKEGRAGRGQAPRPDSGR
jgi:adenylate cyclase class 2